MTRNDKERRNYSDFNVGNFFDCSGYSCISLQALENGLSRILYTWSLLDVFLTYVRPKDVIRLKIRLFFACTAVSIQARLFKYSSARINTPLEVQVYALSRKPSPVTAL